MSIGMIWVNSAVLYATKLGPIHPKIASSSMYNVSMTFDKLSGKFQTELQNKYPISLLIRSIVDDSPSHPYENKLY